MKRKMIYLLGAVALFSILLCGCEEKEPPKEQYTVSFDANFGGASALPSRSVSAGEKIETPAAPTREGYRFSGWFRDCGLETLWDLNADTVSGNCTLYAGWDKNSEESFATAVQDKDFSAVTTPEDQERAYQYRLNFLPETDGDYQPYVGDPMPYYEDGVYYIYYLKDGGDSYHHSVYLATTTDFVTYTEVDAPVLEASREDGQDSWIGTGSLVKIDGKYYFFYTGHAANDTFEYKEKILLAVGDDPYSFQKVDGWEMIPPEEIGQKRDFRDPQAYYDADTDRIYMTVTASKNGLARVLGYTLSAELKEIHYEGILITDPLQSFWNLECSDCFFFNGKWYITYSAQNDTLWYAVSDSRFGEYSRPVRLEGTLFYAAKHASDGEHCYLIGWARRSESPSSTQEVSAWGGNLTVHQLTQKEDGTLTLSPVNAVCAAFDQRRQLLIPGTAAYVEAGSGYTYKPVFFAYERFLISGEFRFTGEGSFGFAFDFGASNQERKFISVDLAEKCISLSFGEGSTPIAQTSVSLKPGKDYSFTYIQEGSVGVFYLDGRVALTVRLYGVTGKPISLFAENNQVIFSCLREYTMREA